MSRAQILIRSEPPFRSEAFASGLKQCGYAIERHIAKPSRDDVVVVWNRYAVNDSEARRFEAAGAQVLLTENGYLGREWNGGVWYSIARNHHNGYGTWHVGGPERWASWRVPMQPWRTGGTEIVVLAQRGIGCDPVREPRGWANDAAAMLRTRTKRPIRIRQHPGERGMATATPLEYDLRNAWACVTWGSGAALKALLMGIPVFYGLKRWIGAPAALPWTEDLEQPFRGDRLPCFEQLAWAVWRLDEIESGEPFRHLLK